MSLDCVASSVMLPGAVVPVDALSMYDVTSAVIVLVATVAATAIAAPLPPPCAETEPPIV